MIESFEEVKVRLEKSTEELRAEVNRMILQSKIDTVVITILMLVIGFMIGWKL